MEPCGASNRALGEVDLPEELPAVIRPSAHPLMKTMLKAVVLLACVLFVGAMVRMQHATFAERATRSLVHPATTASNPPPGSSDCHVSRVCKTEPRTQETRT